MIVHLRRYWIQLTADKRKFTVLCAMIGVGLLLWARLIVISNMPRTALADKPERVQTAERPITPRTTDNRHAAPIRVVLSQQPQRDPFVIDELYFPNPTSVGDLPADPAKSAAQQAEDPEEAEARIRSQLQVLVDQFTLDAAMTGASLAVIGGTTYRLGDRIAAIGSEQVLFTLADVRQRSVTLEFEGRRFELKMETPGG